MNSMSTTNNITPCIYTPSGQSITPLKVDCWTVAPPSIRVSPTIERIKKIFLAVVAIVLVTCTVLISVTILPHALFLISLTVGAVALTILLSYGIYKGYEAYKVSAFKHAQKKFEFLEKSTEELIQATISQNVSPQKIYEAQLLCHDLTKINTLPKVVLKATQNYLEVLNLLRHIANAQSYLKAAESTPHVSESTSQLCYTNIKLHFSNYLKEIENLENKSQFLALTQAALIATLERLNTTLRTRILKMFDWPLNKFKESITAILDGTAGLEELPNLKELLEICNIIKHNNGIAEKIGSPNIKDHQVKKIIPSEIDFRGLRTPIISAIILLAAKSFIDSCREAKEKDLISEKNTQFELKLLDIIHEIESKLSKLFHSQPHDNYILGRIVRTEARNLEAFIDMDILLLQTKIQKITTEIPKLQKAALSCQHRWRFRIKKEYKCEYRNILAQRKKQLSDPTAEKSRLEKEGLAEKIRRQFNVNDERIIPIGRALERKLMYQGSHYVFINASALYATVINDLNRELTRFFKPEKYRPFSPHFRMPELVPRTQNVDVFFKKYQGHQLHDHIPHIRDQLLCVDAYFWNNLSGESAIDFFTSNVSVVNVVHSVSKAFLKQYLPDQHLCSQIADRINQISLQKQAESRFGALNVICVPKTIIRDPKRNIAYRSMSGGHKCTRYPDSEHIDILDEHQNDKLRHNYKTSYRLLTSGLSRIPGIRSFRFTTLTPEKRKYYRDAIRQIAFETFVYARIYKLQAKPSEAASKILTEDIQKLVKQKDFDKTHLQTLLKSKSNFINVVI